MVPKVLDELYSAFTITANNIGLCDEVHVQDLYGGTNFSFFCNYVLKPYFSAPVVSRYNSLEPFCNSSIFKYIPCIIASQAKRITRYLMFYDILICLAQLKLRYLIKNSICDDHSVRR